jgi:hypothetical protein
LERSLVLKNNSEEKIYFGEVRAELAKEYILNCDD